MYHKKEERECILRKGHTNAHVSPGGAAVNVISAEFLNWKLLIRKPSKLFLHSLLTRLLWKVSSRQVYGQSLQFWWRLKPPKRPRWSPHEYGDRMRGLWIWNSWTYWDKDGGRQKSASHQSSEFSNFSICQRVSGGRALASGSHLTASARRIKPQWQHLQAPSTFRSGSSSRSGGQESHG